MSLPMYAEIVVRALAELDRANGALREAGDWLRSDWCDQPPTAATAERVPALDMIGKAKVAIEAAKSGLGDAYEEAVAPRR